MEAKRIKKILFGVLVSDGSIDLKTQRFDLYTKQKEYAEYLYKVFSELTHTRFSLKEIYDKRFGVKGYRLWSTKSRYLTKLREKFYPFGGRKKLTRYIVKRIDAEALAHIWMCDGYLEHSKNRKRNKVQNIGWLCLESYPKEELELLQEHLRKTFGIDSSLVRKPWGFGHRIRIGGENLKKLISVVYPYVLDCFRYKTILFYREKDKHLGLPSAEHFIVEYSGVDDIVRHPSKGGKTDG